MKQVTPSTSLSRKVGIEVEIDDPNAAIFPGVEGWDCKSDGSIRGHEYVLSKPTKVNSAKNAVTELSKALKAHNMRPHMRGSVHVHVQAADVSKNACYALNEIYFEMQPLFRTLLASYRFGSHGRRYAPAEHHESSVDLATHFGYRTQEATTRDHAKRSRKYAAVNFAMMGCADANQRSVEFRQFSTSTRVDVIYAYAIISAAMVEAVVNGVTTVDGMQAALSTHFPEWTEWQAWRVEHLAGGEDAEKAIKAHLSTLTVGVYAAAKAGNCSVGAARKILNRLVSTGQAMMVRPCVYCGFPDVGVELAAIRAAQSSWLTS